MARDRVTNLHGRKKHALTHPYITLVVAHFSPKIVIIGGGPGGLAAGILLSHAGADVTVLERQIGWAGAQLHLGNKASALISARHSFCIPECLQKSVSRLVLIYGSRYRCESTRTTSWYSAGGGELVATC